MSWSFLPTEVIASALHVADIERPENRLKKWDILVEQLLLQALGPSRDNDSPPRDEGESQRGIEVGERLAGAGAGLYNEVRTLYERLLDPERHLELAGRYSKRSPLAWASTPVGEKNSPTLGIAI